MERCRTGILFGAVAIFCTGWATLDVVPGAEWIQASVLLLAAGFIGAIGFGGGHWFAAKTGSGVSSAELVELTEELQQARDHIDTIRQENEDTLDAMAFRIAQMNARMIRLDALGRRLTEMANLEDGEFDFDEPPAMGGPEEPVASGSNVADQGFHVSNECAAFDDGFRVVVRPVGPHLSTFGPAALIVELLDNRKRSLF